MRFSFFGVLLILFYNTSTAQEKISIEQVVALALERNYDIKLSQNVLLAASTDDKYAPGAFLPTLNATGTRVWNNNNQKQELANGDDVERNGVESNLLTGSVQLQWMLFDGTRMFATRERISQIEAAGRVVCEGTNGEYHCSGHYQLPQHCQTKAAVKGDSGTNGCERGTRKTSEPQIGSRHRRKTGIASGQG